MSLGDEKLNEKYKKLYVLSFIW